MKIIEKFEAMLVENGMFPEQAKAVMQEVVTDEASAPMSGRWTDDVDGYPPELFAVIWFSVKEHALAWIDANLPKAWFRSMFE